MISPLDNFKVSMKLKKSYSIFFAEMMATGIDYTERLFDSNSLNISREIPAQSFGNFFCELGTSLMKW